MLLLIDIGNTRIKWAELTDGVLGAQSARVHAGEDHAAVMSDVVHGTSKPEGVWVSNVGGERIAEACAEAVECTWDLKPQFVRAQSRQALSSHESPTLAFVTNAYQEPEKLGTDRWLALIAAYDRTRAAVCIASIGTAMTVDAVDATGRHLGGVIVAGPQLMIGTLLRSTSDIAGRMGADAGDRHLFAQHTQGAVQQGCAHALGALVDRAVVTLMDEVGSRPALMLTGGASEEIAAYVEAPYELVPDLVLRGLALVAMQGPA